jgi:heme-degrading monooxygenase HmoA
MIITIFRSRLRAGCEDEYRSVAERMDALAATMPGFRTLKTFTADDGERVSIVEFDSEEAQEAWHRHPEHVEAQRLGREKFYAEYRIIVCAPVRSGAFHGAGRSP